MQCQQTSRPTATAVIFPSVSVRCARLCSRVYGRVGRSRLCVSNDASARVRGDCKRVFLYATNLELWPAWYPGIVSASRTNASEGSHTSVGAKFALNQNIAGLGKTWTMYEVVEVESYKRVVWSHSSDVHAATDQLVFMQDPTDPSFTIVRYMSNLRLTDWRAALQPMMAGVLTKIPEKAIANLQRLLNTSDPLASIKVPGKAEMRAASGAAASSTGRAPNASKAALSVRQQRQQFLKSIGGFFNRGQGSAGVAELALTDELTSSDPLGYYRLLGLPAATATADDVKAAFRRLAQTMHPDKAVSKNEAGRVAAAAAFRSVQEAYEVLRDPEAKAAYDQGIELETSSANGSR